jgi:hypothetical protein
VEIWRVPGLAAHPALNFAACRTHYEIRYLKAGLIGAFRHQAFFDHKARGTLKRRELRKAFLDDWIGPLRAFHNYPKPFALEDRGDAFNFLLQLTEYGDTRVHVRRQLDRLRRCRCYPDERGVQKELGKCCEILSIARHVGGVQRRIGVAIDRSANLRPSCFQMRVVSAQYGAAAETVISLISGEGFVACVINEEKQIVGQRFQFFGKDGRQINFSQFVGDEPVIEV